MDDTGAQEAAPLVHDGVIYLPGPRGVIQALDGATGDLIWEYRPGITLRVDGTSTSDNSGLAAGAFAGVGRGVQKNIAIYGDMLFAATGDASLVAVDARTGREVWTTAVADPSLGYRYVAGAANTACTRTNASFVTLSWKPKRRKQRTTTMRATTMGPQVVTRVFGAMNTASPRSNAASASRNSREDWSPAKA